MISTQLDELLAANGDWPVKGVSEVTAPNGFYFSSAVAFGDTVMTTLKAGDAAYTDDSYLSKTLPSGAWHPFLAQITKITLSSGELQCFLKRLSQ